MKALRRVDTNKVRNDVRTVKVFPSILVHFLSGSHESSPLVEPASLQLGIEQQANQE